MIQQLSALLLLSIIVIGGSASFRPARSATPESCTQNHEAWLKQVAERIEAIKPGMTRWDLLRVLRTEGPSHRNVRLGRSSTSIARIICQARLPGFEN